MKKTFKILSLFLCLTMLLICFAGCGEEKKTESLGTIKLGIHQGQSATQCGFLMDDLKINEKYNFEIDLIVTTGPNVYASLSTGAMDIGFLGNGMAWHYFEPEAKMQILTIDNLTNDDRLIMKKSSGISENAPISELYEKLPGMNLAVDLTTTPGTFLKSLVNEINKGKEDSAKIWYEDVDKAYPLKGAKDKQVIIMNTTNANMTAVIEDSKVDGCVSFGPQKVAILNKKDKFHVSATTFTHLSDTVTPSTYGINTEFAEKNPELARAFMSALLEALDYRSAEKNWDDCIERAMKFDQLPRDVYDFTAAHWLSGGEIKDYFSSKDGEGYKYLKQIRNSHLGSNGLTEATAKSINDAFASEILLDVIK